MAHGDSSCCAVCDRKLTFGDEATKEEICSGCMRQIHDMGIKAYTGAELVDWINKQSPEVIELFVEKAGVHRCYYDNLVDKAIESKLGDKYVR